MAVRLTLGALGGFTMANSGTTDTVFLGTFDLNGGFAFSMGNDPGSLFVEGVYRPIEDVLIEDTAFAGPGADRIVREPGLEHQIRVPVRSLLKVSGGVVHGRRTGEEMSHIHLRDRLPGSGGLRAAGRREGKPRRLRAGLMSARRTNWTDRGLESANGNWSGEGQLEELGGRRA